MNQYIITEEVAEIIETALESDEHCKKCPYEGWGFNQSALSLLRECPYQSGRDKVLDKVEKAISHCPDRSICLQKIEKLRQAGEP